MWSFCKGFGSLLSPCKAIYSKHGQHRCESLLIKLVPKISLQAKFTQLAKHLDSVLDACVNGNEPVKSPRSQKMDELQAMLNSLKAQWRNDSDPVSNAKGSCHWRTGMEKVNINPRDKLVIPGWESGSSEHQKHSSRMWWIRGGEGVGQWWIRFREGVFGFRVNHRSEWRCDKLRFVCRKKCRF